MTDKDPSAKRKGLGGSWDGLRSVRVALRGHRRLLLAGVVVGFLAGLAEAATVGIIALAAGSLTDGAHRIHIAVVGLGVTTGFTTLVDVAFAAAAVRLLLQLPAATLPARLATDVQAGIRDELFDAFSATSWSEQSRDVEGALQELMTNQAMVAANAASGFAGLINTMISFVIMIGAAFLLDPSAAAAVLAIVVAMAGVMRPMNRLVLRRSHALSQTQLDLASGIGQAARLAQEVQSFGVEDGQRRRVHELIGTTRRLSYRIQVLARIVPSVYQTVIYLLVLGALATLGSAHASHVATLGAVVLLLVRAGNYGQGVQSSYQGLLAIAPFADRVYAAIRRYNETAAPHGELSLRGLRTIEARNVSYSYDPRSTVLTDVSFTVDAGETVGIVGPSGAGKSTLIQILLGLRSPETGSYLVNGVSAERFRRRDWHEHFAFVPQEPRLLHATVAENIRFFREISEADVEAAARLALIHDEVLGWPDGYATIVGPRADAVSGGQQQRICIARALVGHPAVLVLDEPTSALDPHSESLIQESLTSLKDQLTLFIVAHRMSTLEICTRIMVVLDGRLEAFGTPASLRASNPYYQRALAVATRGAGI
ncbi:MAG: ABC transporter ATP-binding protein [Solirubrobacteraceae bacterium]|jgi:ABC-type multidrug transport system fused ATPase/permease subunit